MLLRAPWVAATGAKTTGGGVAGLDLETSVVVSAHPAAVMLALLAARVSARFRLKSLVATVLEPASQYGRLAMDELHQQTVSLLSFQSLPREQYDAQAAFNLLRALGEDAKVKLAETEVRIEAQYASLLDGGPELLLQLIHAPVFHGYVASIFVELEEAKTAEEVELSLVGEHIDLVAAESEPPSNSECGGTGRRDGVGRCDQEGAGDALQAAAGRGQPEAGGGERDCVREGTGAVEAAG